MWVTRAEKELRLVSGSTQLEAFGFEGKIESVFPLDDLTSSERQQAEDLLLRAERREDELLLARAMGRRGALA